MVLGPTTPVSAGKGAELASSQGTAWGLLNAVTQYVDHERRARSQDSRMDSAWFGQGPRDLASGQQQKNARIAVALAVGVVGGGVALILNSWVALAVAAVPVFVAAIERVLKEGPRTGDLGPEGRGWLAERYGMRNAMLFGIVVETIGAAVSAGIANPKPTLPPVVEKIEYDRGGAQRSMIRSNAGCCVGSPRDRACG